MADEQDTAQRGGVPLIAKVVILVLAVIGLFSVWNFVIGTALGWIVRGVIFALVLVGAWVVARAIFRRDRPQTT